MPARILALTGTLAAATAVRMMAAIFSGLLSRAEPAHLLKTIGAGQPKLRSIHTAPTRSAARMLSARKVGSLAMNCTPTGTCRCGGPR